VSHLSLWPLIWANVGRRKLRVIFTFLCICTAFGIFGMLDAVRTSFQQSLNLVGADRLLVFNKAASTDGLPFAHVQKIRGIDGVKAVIPMSWMGAMSRGQEVENAIFATSPREFLEIYPEVKLAESERQALISDRRAIAVGSVLANRYGWKIGDNIPLRSVAFQKLDGSSSWDFQVVAIYEIRESAVWSNDAAILHFPYFNDSLASGRDLASYLVVQVSDSSAAESVARRIDTAFANSGADTNTVTETYYTRQLAMRVGNVTRILLAVIAASFFTMLLVVANTMAQSIRERRSELGVMMVLGFSHRTILSLIVVESCLLTLLAGLSGLALSYALVTRAALSFARFLPVFEMNAETVLRGVSFMLITGIVAAVVPAIQTRRLSIVDSLAQRA